MIKTQDKSLLSQQPRKEGDSADNAARHPVCAICTTNKYCSCDRPLAWKQQNLASEYRITLIEKETTLVPCRPSERNTQEIFSLWMSRKSKAMGVFLERLHVRDIWQVKKLDWSRTQFSLNDFNPCFQFLLFPFELHSPEQNRDS